MTTEQIIYCVIFPIFILLTILMWFSFLIVKSDYDDNDPEDVKLKRDTIMDCITLSTIDCIFIIGLIKYLW